MNYLWIDARRTTDAHRDARATRFAKLARCRVRQRLTQGFPTYTRRLTAPGTPRDSAASESGRPALPTATMEALHTVRQDCGLVYEQRSGCPIGPPCVPCRSAIAMRQSGVFSVLPSGRRR